MLQRAGAATLKEYACLCEGPSLGDVGYQGQISVPLRTLQIDETWQSEACDLGDGSEAVTDFEVMERYLPPFSEESAQGTSEGELKELIFLKVFPKTGRRHQIRVHFSSLSRPLVGDLTYGPGLGGSLLPTERLFLHCRSLSFLDLEGKSFQVNSSLPEELLDLLQTLDKMVPGQGICQSTRPSCITASGFPPSAPVPQSLPVPHTLPPNSARFSGPRGSTLFAPCVQSSGALEAKNPKGGTGRCSEAMQFAKNVPKPKLVPPKQAWTIASNRSCKSMKREFFVGARLVWRLTLGARLGDADVNAECNNEVMF